MIETKYKSMNLTDIANKYKISVRTLKKWMKEFCPDIKPAEDSNTFTPLQVSGIVSACGEFPG